MKKYDCIFLDRDGTLNSDPGYISSIEDFSFFGFTILALQKMALDGNIFCIITNQSGVGRGLIKKNKLEVIHSFIKAEFKRNKIPLLDIYVCFDHPDNPSDRRKPGISMFNEAKKDHGLNLSNCLMIGDSIIDIKSGKKIGMDTMLVLTGNGKTTRRLLTKENFPKYVVNDLKEGAEVICL